MVTIHATKKLLDKLKIAPAAVLPVTDGRLGPWYADARIVSKQHIVVLANEATLLSLIIPWMEFKVDPAAALRAGLRTLLHDLDIPDAMIDEELATIGNVTFTKTASKVMLGRMNAPAFMIEQLIADGRSFRSIERQMLPYYYTPSKSDPETHYFTPNRRTCALFGVDPKQPPTIDAYLALQPSVQMPAPTSTPTPLQNRRLLTDVLILRIELDGIRPVIWRTVMVPAKITLRRLHDVIQAAMGWDDSHLHAFTIKGRSYADRSVFEDDTYGSADGSSVKEERSVTLNAFDLSLDDTFTYEYDMGDGWKHTITVVGTDTVEPDSSFRIIDGDNACPPEDVGGVGGYAWFVLAMMDPQHKDHDHVLGWFGRPFNYTMLDLRAAQRLLRVLEFSGAGYPWKK